MSLPYIGEIRLLPYTFAPNGWLFCEGQTLSISENSVLFVLIGTTYGGDGVNTFALPDLRGRVPVGFGLSYQLGAIGGTETVSLTSSQLPQHQHGLNVAGAATSYTPVGQIPGVAPHGAYGAAAATTLASDAVAPTGSGAGHENRQPYAAMGFAISLFGVFPSQN